MRRPSIAGSRFAASVTAWRSGSTKIGSPWCGEQTSITPAHREAKASLAASRSATVGLFASAPRCKAIHPWAAVRPRGRPRVCPSSAPGHAEPAARTARSSTRCRARGGLARGARARQQRLSALSRRRGVRGPVTHAEAASSCTKKWSSRWIASARPKRSSELAPRSCLARLHTRRTSRKSTRTTCRAWLQRAGRNGLLSLVWKILLEVRVGPQAA